MEYLKNDDLRPKYDELVNIIINIYLFINYLSN